MNIMNNMHFVFAIAMVYSLNLNTSRENIGIILIRVQLNNFNAKN